MDLESSQIGRHHAGCRRPDHHPCPEAEAYLVGKELTDEVIARAGELAAAAARPIDDIRGSAAYRKAMVSVLVQRGLAVPAGWAKRQRGARTPVLLASNTDRSPEHSVIHRLIPSVRE